MWGGADVSHLVAAGYVTALAALKADYVASGSRDNTVRIFNRKTGVLLHTLTGHSGGLSLCARNECEL